MNTPEQDKLLLDIFFTIREHIEGSLDFDLEEEVEVEPTASGRMSAEIFNNAIHWCKSILAAYYEFDEDNLKARATPIAGSDWVTLSRESSGWGMKEYLLDCSISHGAIPMAIQQYNNKLPAGVKYEPLLGLESELGENPEICRDLLKLLDVKCRIKVLLYTAKNTASPANKFKARMEAILNSHANEPSDSLWLIAGVPTYKQWREFKNNRAQTPRQVYTLATEGGIHKLIEKPEWWPL